MYQSGDFTCVICQPDLAYNDIVRSDMTVTYDSILFFSILFYCPVYLFRDCSWVPDAGPFNFVSISISLDVTNLDVPIPKLPSKVLFDGGVYRFR